MEPLTPEEKEAFLARARAEGRSLTSEEQYALFGPPQAKVEEFRAAEVVDEMEAARLDAAQIADLERNFFPELGAAAPETPRLLRGVIFAFRNTIATLNRPLDELLAQGAADAVAYMRSTGMELPEEFAANVVEARRFAEEKSEEESEEHLADDALAFLLQFFGFPTSRMDPDVLRRAVDIFYAPEMTAWRLRPRARELLEGLHAEGYRIAVMDNYNADRVFQRAIDYLGIRPWLDLCISSAAVEYRMPDPKFFEIALEKWGALAYEVVVVGDSRKEAIAGALETGCLSVLLEAGDGGAQVMHDNATLAATVRPDAVITSLPELPAIVAAWAY